MSGCRWWLARFRVNLTLASGQVQLFSLYIGFDLKIMWNCQLAGTAQAPSLNSHLTQANMVLVNLIQSHLHSCIVQSFNHTFLPSRADHLAWLSHTHTDVPGSVRHSAELLPLQTTKLYTDGAGRLLAVESWIKWTNFISKYLKSKTFSKIVSINL